jgi:general secretion pathway protein D
MKQTAALSVLSILLLSTAAIAQPPVAAELRRTNMDDLIDRVAAEIGKEIVVDPRLPSEILGYTTKDDADYESFLALLRINGYATIETADQILVIPEGISRSNPTLIVQEDDRNVSDHEIVTRVLNLPNLPDRRTPAQIEDQIQVYLAIQLVPVLRPMLSQSAQLAAAPGTNKLVIVDRYDNVRRITAVIEELTKDLED